MEKHTQRHDDVIGEEYRRGRNPHRCVSYMRRSDLVRLRCLDVLHLLFTAVQYTVSLPLQVFQSFSATLQEDNGCRPLSGLLVRSRNKT